MFGNLVIIGILALVATAQDVPSGVKYDLTGLAYPRVGRLARVQGVVTLQLIPNGTGQEIKLISGNAILVREPTSNLAKWRADQPVTVSYVFKLTDEVEMVKVRVPKGNAFGRLWLRMFHLATYTEKSQCSGGLVQVAEPRMVQQSPLILEIEIAAGAECVQTETSLVASR